MCQLCPSFEGVNILVVIVSHGSETIVFLYLLQLQGHAKLHTTSPCQGNYLCYDYMMLFLIFLESILMKYTFN